MQIEVIVEDSRWQEVPLDRLAGAVGAALAGRLGLGDGWAASLMAADDAGIAALNAQFRGKPTPPNVLSWPAQPLAPAGPGLPPPAPQRDPHEPDTHLGDIALAYETCAREAAGQGIALADHTTHLVLHGALHLLGFDHETAQDAAVMEGIEREILGQMGIKDPYADES